MKIIQFHQLAYNRLRLGMRWCVSFKFFWTSIFTTAGVCAFGQTDNIKTDRPGISLSPHTVLHKYAQGELGLMRQVFTYSKPWNETYFFHPSSTFKYGLFKGLELRAIAEFATLKAEAVNGTRYKTGLTNLQLGLKCKLLDEKGMIPHTALIVHYRFNHLQTLYKDSIDGANFRLAMEHTISPAFLLRYNTGMSWKRFSSNRSPAFEYSISPRVIIEENWLLFAELYGSAWKRYGPVHSADVGFSYQINRNLRVDLSGGLNFGKRDPAHFIATGISFAADAHKKSAK